MGIEITQKTDVHIIYLSGRIDAAALPSIKPSITHLYQHSQQNYIVSLEEVAFLDSAGLAMLVNLLKHSRANQGAVVLVWSKRKEANRILTLTKFDKVFKTANTVEEAISCLI